MAQQDICSSQYQEDVLFAMETAKLAIATLPPANQESSLLEYFNLEDQKCASHKSQKIAQRKHIIIKDPTRGIINYITGHRYNIF